MPIYEYRCNRCGQFECWQRITESPLRKCPTCGTRCQRLISLPSGYVVEPHGVYVPRPGRDKRGRQNEERISPREYARQDDAHRAVMMANRARAKRMGLTPTFE